jgi:hypothetical protein
MYLSIWNQCNENKVFQAWILLSEGLVGSYICAYVPWKSQLCICTQISKIPLGLSSNAYRGQFYNAPPMWPPVIPWGYRPSVRPSIFLKSRKCSPLGVNEGVNRGANITPRGQSSPLGPSSPLGIKVHPWGQTHAVKNWPLCSICSKNCGRTTMHVPTSVEPKLHI